MNEEPKYPVQTVAKALEVIEYLSKDYGNRGVGITDMANDLNMAKSAIHRILDTLAYYGYVTKNPDTSRYRLGWGLYTVGQRVPQQNQIFNLDSAYLVELCNKTGETVNLGVRDRNETILLSTLEGSTLGLRVGIQAGEHESIHATALGKILVSEMAPDDVRSLLGPGPFHKYTNNTIENVEDFLKELDVVRANGYSVDNEEFGIGLLCMGMPVRDYTGKIIAAVSVSPPKSRVDDAKKKEILDELAECCRRISWNLGYKE